MALLLLFALIAGAGTALSPCVLPVLPAVLSAGASGGRRRPLGVVLGLTATFTVAIAALASVVKGVGVAAGAIRVIAVVVLALAGLALLVPALGDRLEARLSRLGGARIAARTGGDGFWSGVGLGGALGFLYAPCAGPILAAVISVGATRGTSLKIVLVALAYAAGSALVLLALALGGRRVVDRIRRAGRGPALARALGAVLLLTAVAMVTRADVRFQEALARHAPAFLVDPTHALETSAAVERRLVTLRGRAAFASAPASPSASEGARLPRLGHAPEFRDTERWFNTPGNRPLTLGGLRGRVVLVDFWTYTCINCIRTLPFLRALDERYRRAGLTIVGVHTPEFSFEHDAANVESAVRSDGLRYPVAQDNAYGTWNAWQNAYWPAEYLVDGTGQVRRAHFGEGEYRATEAAVRSLLRERGSARLPPPVTAIPKAPDAALATPETYLGSERAERWAPALPRDGVHVFPRPAGNSLPLSRFAYAGRWRITRESGTALAPGAAIDAEVRAQKVFLVLSSEGERPRTLTVLVDGRPYRRVVVTRQRLYTLADFGRPERHLVTLRFAPGLSGYAFTFG